MSYTREEEENCVIGQSLLSRPVPDDRVMMSWQGKPLQVYQIGIFSTASEALMHYVKDPSKTKQIAFASDSNDLFFNRSEHMLNEATGELSEKWSNLLKKNGLLEHDMVNEWMPKLKELLEN